MTLPAGSEGETLIDLVEATARRHADRVALRTRVGLRDQAWTYAQLWRAIGAAAAALADDGVRPGDRVALIGRNEPRLVATLLGAMRAGAIAVPIDEHATPGFTDRLLVHTGAALLVDGTGAPGTRACRVRPLESLPLEPTRDLAGRPRPGDVAEIVSTSGTTGQPKGVVLTHANVMANVRSSRRVFPEREDYRLLSLLPLSHMLEQMAGLLVPFAYGASITYPASRQPAVVLDALQRGRATTMVVVPALMRVLLDAIEHDARRAGAASRLALAHRLAARLPLAARRVVFSPLHRRLGGSLSLLICGGACLPEPLAAAFERMGVGVIHGYGATECSPIVSATSPGDRPPASAGRPLPGVEVRIAGDGEIQVRGANVTAGYWRDEATTAAAFTGDGWYRTGDLGALDGRGHLFVDGRLRDLIVLDSGLKVDPEDVEDVLRAEPGVADCVVLARSDERGAVRVHAAVRPHDDAPQAERERLVAKAVRHANVQLAPHQRVAGFTLWNEEDFPRTTMRKVRRGEVLARLDGEPGRDPSPATVPAAGTERLACARRLLASVCDVPEGGLHPDADLALDLGLDSVSRLELALGLEAELGTRLGDADLAQVATVADLLRVLSDQDAASAGPSTRPAAWPRSGAACAAREALQRLVLFPAHARICRPFTVDGTQHLAGLDSPVLLVANHASHLDAPSILRALPARLRRRTAVAAAADYFYATPVRGAAVSLLVGGVPFSRSGRTRESLETCGALVDAGWSVLVFPEGTRSLTGRIGEFRRGIGVLAVGLRVPIVPIAVTGTFALLPKGASRPGTGPVAVRFGPAIVLSTGAAHDEVTARLEDAVRGLAGAAPPSAAASPPAARGGEAARPRRPRGQRGRERGSRR